MNLFKKKHLLTFLSIGIFSNALLAQSAFDGFNIEASFGAQAVHSQLHGTDEGEFAALYNYGKSSPTAAVAAGYSYSFANSFNLALSLFYNFVSPSMHAQGYPVSGSDYENLLLDRVWGANIEPGYYFTDSTLGYVKLGWAHTASKYEAPGYSTVNFGSHGGLLLGFGVKQSVTDSFYLGLDAYQIQFAAKEAISTFYGDRLKNKPSLTYACIKLGFHF